MTEIRNMFTTGNAITLGVIIFGGAVTWGTFTSELTQNGIALGKLEARITVLENAVGTLSVQYARTDEKLINILSYLQRIDNKLSAQDLREGDSKP